jgi:hypothetical protein
MKPSAFAALVVAAAADPCAPAPVVRGPWVNLPAYSDGEYFWRRVDWLLVGPFAFCWRPACCGRKFGFVKADASGVAFGLEI